MLISIISLLLSFSYIQDCCSKTIILSNNNFVSLVGPVTTNSVDDVIKSLNNRAVSEYIQDNKNINLYINSPGGSVFAGNHLVQYIKTLQDSNISVNCIAQNFMSMGFVIMQSCTKRYVMFDSIGMQHQMSLGLKGNIENLRNHFRLIDRVNNILIDMEIKKIGIAKESYLLKILSDWWLYGEENVFESVADELITVRCTSMIYNEKVKKSESFLGFDFELEMNKCPIINEIKFIDKYYNSSSPIFGEINKSNLYIFYDFEKYPVNAKEIITYFKN